MLRVLWSLCSPLFRYSPSPLFHWRCFLLKSFGAHIGTEVHIYNSVKIPIIGTGGVSTGAEVIEMMMAGATLVGVGSAIHFREISVFNKIDKEIQEWCTKNNVDNLQDIIGSVKI